MASNVFINTIPNFRVKNFPQTIESPVELYADIHVQKFTSTIYHQTYEYRCSIRGTFSKYPDAYYPLIRFYPGIFRIGVDAGAPDSFIARWEVNIADNGWETTSTDFNSSIEQNITYVEEDSVFITVDTNMPIIIGEPTAPFVNFMNEEEWRALRSVELTNENCQTVYNFTDSEEQISDDAQMYFFYNVYGVGTATFEGFKILSNKQSRYENIYTANRIVRYPEGNNEYILAGKPVNGSEYSDISLDYLVPHESEIAYYGPFGRPWDGKTVGSALSFSELHETNIPYAKTKEDAEKYILGEGDDIEYPTDPYKKGNDTGEDESETEMGNVGHGSLMSQQYICSEAAIREIANKFYSNDPSIIENIKKGLEMWGSNPAESIISLMYFPVNLGNVFDKKMSQNYIYFGSYRMELESNVQKILYHSNKFEFGNTFISYSYGGTWKDFEPYQELHIFLPYIGFKQLELSKYLNKRLRVTYYFDTNTGLCNACLFANNVLTDFFQGKCAVTMPITSTDFSAYASAEIGALVGGAGNIVSAAGKGAGIGGMTGTPVGITGGLAVGAGVGAVSSVLSATKNNISSYTKTEGNPSSMLSEFLPQYAYVIFKQNDFIEPSNLRTLKGKPSNYSGTISSFSGFLKVKDVNLVCPNATEKEKDMIVALLRTGVYL